MLGNEGLQTLVLVPVPVKLQEMQSYLVVVVHIQKVDESLLLQQLPENAVLGYQDVHPLFYLFEDYGMIGHLGQVRGHRLECT